MNSIVQPSAERIMFPALNFDQGWLSVVLSQDALTHPSRLGVKEGFYQNLTLVDSSGNKFRVRSARKVRTVVNVSFGSVLAWLGGNPTWQMEVEFEPPVKISLNEVKNLITESFKKREEYWEEMSDFDDFHEQIVTAKSVDQIFGAFKEASLF